MPLAADIDNLPFYTTHTEDKVQSNIWSVGSLYISAPSICVEPKC